MTESFDYSEEGIFDQLRSWDVDVDELLEQSREEQKAWLQRELERIDQQWEQRDEVHEKIVAQLEWKIDRYTDRLENLYRRSRGKRDGKRERIKDRIESFYEELWEERRQHWRVRQQLEEERRRFYGVRCSEFTVPDRRLMSSLSGWRNTSAGWSSEGSETRARTSRKRPGETKQTRRSGVACSNEMLV